MSEHVDNTRWQDEPLIGGWEPQLLPDEKFERISEIILGFTPNDCCDANASTELHEIAATLINHILALKGSAP